MWGYIKANGALVWSYVKLSRDGQYLCIEFIVSHVTFVAVMFRHCISGNVQKFYIQPPRKILDFSLDFIMAATYTQYTHVSITCAMTFYYQMNMFLNKLTGDSIGLTAMDLFVIDKPTLLTVTAP